jgi:uncharacterized protein
MKLFALALSCMLIFSAPVRASDADLFNAMLTLANKGDAEAQYHVGMMNNNGIGTRQDIRQAFEWFQQSAASDDPLGAYKLGCYFDGQGAGVVETNPDEALKYKLVAAKAGYSLAQFDVAVHYARQDDFDEAVKWLQEAGEQGHDKALYGLYSSYHEGKGAPKDLSLAFAYFKLAHIASQTELNADAEAALNEMSAQMSDAEFEKAQKLVAEWKPQPTDLTLKAQLGISAAEAYVQKAK